MSLSELQWLSTSHRDSGDKFLEACIECDAEAALQCPFAQSILHTPPVFSLRDFWSGLDQRLASAAESEAAQFKVLLLGVALLNAFLQVNYTGPALRDLSPLLLPDSLLQLPSDALQAMLLEDLTKDGERPYPLAEKLLYLSLANRIIHHKALYRLHSLALWKIRVGFIHQKLLDEPVSSIHNIICDEDHINSVDQLFQNDQNLQAKWHLELAYYYSYYSYDQKAMHHVEEAQRKTGLSMQVSGALGRRTKFQTFDVSQLVVLAKSAPDTVRRTEGSAIPKMLNLDDDTLLETVSFTKQRHAEAPYSTRWINPIAKVVSQDALPPELADIDPGNQPQLSMVDRCILLAYAGVIKVSAASDDQIIIEQVAAYVARVLQKSVDSRASDDNWSVNTAALLARTRIEGHRSRTVERSVLQLQALVDQLVDEIVRDTDLPTLGDENDAHLGDIQTPSFLRRATQGDSAPAKERLMPIFCLPMASRWDLQLELARKYTSIGLVKSALEIFHRLECWEQVAMCYGAMDREDKAETVIRKQLELAKPGADLPKLWCLLGDVTSDAQFWEKSWEVSHHRYARAQRSLGKHYFAQKDYRRTIEAYALSLKINPLNHGAWFIYGCAGLEIAQFELAAEAFTRCISIDQTDGESWNNLASALLRLGKDRKRDAWQALKRATELKHESWRMWENYMLVSLDVGELSECVRALRRCVEIRQDAGESAIDLDVLRELIQEVVSEPSPETDDEIRGLPRMVNDLMLKTIQPLITHDPRLWRLLAKMYLWRRKYAESLEAHEKAYRCLAGRPVETDERAFEEVVAAAEELTDAYRSLGPMDGRMGGVVAKDWQFKSRSVVRTLKSRGLSNFEDTQAYQKLLDILDDLKIKQ